MRLLTKMEEYSAFVEARLRDPNFPGCAGRVLVFPCDVLAKHGEFELCMTEDTTPGTAYMAMIRKSDNCCMAISNDVEPNDVRSQVEFLCASVMVRYHVNDISNDIEGCGLHPLKDKPRYVVTPVTRIQFDNDETEFDTHDEVEAMNLFLQFLRENNLANCTVSGVERLFVWEPEYK